MTSILVVEDDALNRDMLARRLIWEGFDVSTAVNGEQALSLAHHEHPDVILLDMGMPVMNGWETTALLKSQPATCTIPVIALTAYAMNDDRERCFAAGCDDYETKPIEFSRLLRKIKALCA